MGLITARTLDPEPILLNAKVIPIGTPLLYYLPHLYDEEFSIWAARTVDEAIEILTGVPAGERGPDGKYLEGTISAQPEHKEAGTNQ